MEKEKNISVIKKSLVLMIFSAVLALLFFIQAIRANSPDNPLPSDPGANIGLVLQGIDLADPSFPKVYWTTYGNTPVYYWVQVSESSDFAVKAVDTGQQAGNPQSYTIFSGLVAGHSYYVRVSVNDNYSWTPWTCPVTGSFTYSPNNPPSVSNLSSVADYCLSATTRTFSWSYSDPDGDPQSAYQVQVDDNSDFSSLVVDSGKVYSSSTSFATNALSLNKTYYWRMTVWDSRGISISGVSNGNDSYTKLLLHADGTGNSFVDSSPSARTVVAEGNVTQSLTQYKFGGKSGSFDGASDYLWFYDSSDFEFGGGDFTIDFWINFNSFGGANSTQEVLCHANDGSYNGYWLEWDNGANYGMRFFARNGIVDIFPELDSGISGWSAGTWYHIAIVRSGSTWTMYRNGLAVDSATSSGAMDDYSGSPYIGYRVEYGYSPNAYIDEFRISKGIARWTSNFSPPAFAYESGGWISGPDFSTPAHAYPTPDFEWFPPIPTVGGDTLFSDRSTSYGGASIASWQWTIPDANYISPSTSASQNPVVNFVSEGDKNVILRVTDSSGFSCEVSKAIRAQLPLPCWKEVNPR